MCALRSARCVLRTRPRLKASSRARPKASSRARVVGCGAAWRSTSHDVLGYLLCCVTGKLGKLAASCKRRSTEGLSRLGWKKKEGDAAGDDGAPGAAGVDGDGDGDEEDEEVKTATAVVDALRQKRLERLKKLEEAQARAEDAQRRAAEALMRAEAGEVGDGVSGGGDEIREERPRVQSYSELAAANGPPESGGGGALRRISRFFSRNSSGRPLAQHPQAEVESASASADEPSDPQEAPRWWEMLRMYTEQRSQIEGWLACEPTEEEIEDGSAMEKAMTLITARNDLTAKIEQLEAVAAAAQASEGLGPTTGRGGSFASPGRLDRQTSFSGHI